MVKLDAMDIMDTEKDTEKDIKYNVWNELQGKPVETLKYVQKLFTKDQNYGICMFNIQLSGNIGMTIRTACLMGFDKFIICGRHHYDKRFNVGAHNYIDIVYWDSPIHVTISIIGTKNISQIPQIPPPVPKVQQYKETIDYYPEMFITQCKNENWTPIFIEQGGSDIRDPLWKYIEKPLLVLGNESLGIPADFMKTVCAAIPNARIISIPQWSILRSLNIANAATIAMWELRSRSGSSKYTLQ